jgi:hypothetical protein
VAFTRVSDECSTVYGYPPAIRNNYIGQKKS